MAIDPEKSKRNRYEGLLAFQKEEFEKRKQSRMLVESKDIKYEINKNGAICYLIRPDLGFASKTMTGFIRVIPPLCKDGNHRHREEAILHVVSGRGYSIIDGQRYDWKTGDTIAVPPWSWHQHFNTDPKEHARFIAGVNGPEMKALGFGEFEQGEERGWKEEDVKTDLF